MGFNYNMMDFKKILKLIVVLGVAFFAILGASYFWKKFVTKEEFEFFKFFGFIAVMVFVTSCANDFIEE